MIAANGSGVLITGSGTASNHVNGNYIGTNAAAQCDRKSEAGIDISGGASNNQIGDGSTAARNESAAIRARWHRHGVFD